MSICACEMCGLMYENINYRFGTCCSSECCEQLRTKNGQVMLKEDHLKYLEARPDSVGISDARGLLK